MKQDFLGISTPDTEPEAFELVFADQSDEAVALVRQAILDNNPFSVAFVDIRMPPGRDGIETIRALWEIDPSLQAVICTAYSDYSWSDITEHLGYTDRLLILKKPFDDIEVRQMACALYEKWLLVNHLDQMVIERTEQITDTRGLAVFALANLAESRDPETGEHLNRMCRYCRILAERLGADSPYQNDIDRTFIADLYRFSPLHDIGKVGIPDAILLKPGKLTSEEFEIMKEHSAIGADALRKSAAKAKGGDFLRMGIEIANFHHERFDGTGYPDALRDEQIPLSARIVAVADVFDALTSQRVYKRAWPLEKAREYIINESGRQFDPAVVAAFNAGWEDFLAVFQEFGQPESVPVGS